ncbi:MAG: rhomboid family intramembrane serine protease [Bifidobacteriaceae bacterium]|nr:rhomboid family intramembrane serine protease [Bifidobacteriaceae bacterium]
MFGAPLTRGAPVMTIGAIALCVAVFVGQIASGERLTQELILYPAGVWYQPWRLVTSAFLHGSVLHLAFNMYALWLVGGFVEQLVGRTRFATIYLASAIGGHAAVLTSYRVFDFPDFQAAYTGTLGASGAVFGLFAAAFVLSRRLGGNIRGIAVVIGVNLVFGFMVANISWQAHLGGLALGGALALVYAYAPPRRRRAYAWAAGIGAACLLAAVIAATASPWALGG